MRIIATGMDLIENRRIAEVCERHGERLTDRLVTPAELEYIQRHRDPVPRLAGRFAAKEAILKVLGTGWRGQIAWRDMEILNDAAGRPHVTLSGECARVAATLGITEIQLSITHTEHSAAAVAIGVGD